ncbi:MAG TPA: proline dehydrogenase, partial [Mycobacteriales bacterium]|nr:proline dehydrogenase [Mycobacteriales bacterium]
MRSLILAASRNTTVEHLVETAPLTRNVVHRFVPGPSEDDAVAATRRLVAEGLAVSLDHLGEDTTDPEQAAAAAKAYLSVLDRLATEGLTPEAEVSLKLSAVGQALPGDGERIALEHAHLVCAAAERAGTTV